MDGRLTLRSNELPTPFNRRKTTDGIAVPSDFKPKDIIKRKNDSLFTNSLLAGDAPGYAFLEGGPRTTRNLAQKTGLPTAQTSQY